MTELILSNDLDIMMLEFAVDKLILPETSVFDSVVMKKATVMFRMLDSDWVSVNPHRADYAPYNGSSHEEVNFHGGKSVVFAIPAGALETRVKDVEIQIHVIKEVSKYFEVNPSEQRQNVGVALVNVDRLFNGIIKDLREREELKEYLNCFHKRQPISRSLKETYDILDEDNQQTGSSIRIYVRLSYFGKSVVTEIERDQESHNVFYAQEETNEESPYEWRELTQKELQSGFWGSETPVPPMRADQVACYCDKSGVDEKNRTAQVVTDKESSDSESRSSKSPSDGVQMGAGGKVKRGSRKKSERPMRASKSAGEEERRSKPDQPMGVKRVKGDSKAGRKLDKTSKGGGEDSGRSGDYAKLLEQLRKRPKGTITVGIRDRKKNVCQETITRPSASLICPKDVALRPEQCCRSFRYYSVCYHPQLYACRSSSSPLAHGCFTESGTTGAQNFCASIHRSMAPEMQTVTS